jgi:exonuclease SbcD
MKKAIALIITDTHLGDNNHDQNTRVYIEALKLARKLKLKSVEHAGDLFHSRKAQTQRNLNHLGEMFLLFQKAKIELNIVIGNHDKTEYSSPNSFLDSYIHHPFINIFPFGSIRQLEKVTITYASYFSDDEYVEHLNKLKAHEINITNVLITHIGVNGAVMNNGTVIETKINADLFKDYDLTLIGHYHDAQSISSKIKYIGASIQHNFGERPEKGATILYDDLSIETVNFDLPKFKAFKIKATDLTMKDIEDLKDAAKENGDHLRIILTGTKAEIASIDKQRLLISGIDVKSEQELIEKEEIEELIVAFTDTSLLGAFDEFCLKNKLNVKEGLKYLKQALC